MLSWQRQSALGSSKGKENFHQSDTTLRLHELPFRAKLVLQTRPDQEGIHEKAGNAIGQALPLEPNTSAVADHTILWMKPGKWMILTEPGETGQIRKRLESALVNEAYLLSDASDAKAGFEVGGDFARDLLSRVCALDLDASSFEPGQCAQTALVRIPMQLHMADERPTFHLYVDRSMARYAWDWLTDAASELHLGVDMG